ncbi:unnamed protein product [Alternaria alternata]
MSESQDISPDQLDDPYLASYDFNELFPGSHSIDSTTLEPFLQRPHFGSISDATRISTDSQELAILATIPKNERANLPLLDPMESGYGFSEATRRGRPRRRDKPSREQDNSSKGVEGSPWFCQFCGKSYIRIDNLRKHQLAKHNIQSPSGTAKHSQKEASCSLAKVEDVRMTKAMQSNLRETSPVHINKDDSGGTPVTVSLIRRLESCLSELGSQSTMGFRIPLVIKIDGVARNINVDVYDKLQTLPTDSGTMQLGPFLGDVKSSEPEPRPEQLQPPLPPRQVLKVRRRSASLAMDHDNMDAVMDQQPIPTIEAPEIMSNPHTPLVLPPLENSAHSSSKNEVKLMDYQEHDTTDKLYKAKVSKKRENPDDDASHCSGSLVDSSEEGDDSDYECDNIITWNYSQHDALPSFLPYIRGCDENTTSPCSDSPESGSTSSGTPRDTPASSSASGLAGGNGFQGNGYTPPNAGTGFPNNGDSPVLGIKEEFRAKVVKPQPRPLICWYPAAGIACDGKILSSSPNTRYLWRDVEEEDSNREPNRLGISLKCEAAVENIRTYIDKEMKGKNLPALRGGDVEELLKQRVDINVLKQRVDSNVLLYINGSNTNEKTARSELWKWYLIFKKLRPDDELPRNPFSPAQVLAEPDGRSRVDALRTFMQVFDQRRMEGCLSRLDDDQRTALDCVFLDTWDILVAKKASKRQRSIKTRNPRKRQKRSPPEDHGPTPDLTNPTLVPTTPAQAPRQLQQQQQEETEDAHSLFDANDFDVNDLDLDQFFDRLPEAPKEP